MTTLKLSVVLEVHVRVNSDGTIEHVSLPHDRTNLCALVQQQFPASDLAPRVAHATRSRLAEGLVRVESHEKITYYALRRCTKLHIILQYSDRPEVKFRRTGRALLGGAWDRATIEKNDLAAINEKFPA